METILNANLFGNYITMTFSEIFPTTEDFIAAFTDYTSLATGLKSNLTTDDLSVLYILLYQKYGNSCILSTDINQFTAQLVTITYTYYDAYLKQRETQSKLRALTDDQILQGSAAIHNHAFNPDTAPSTASLDELPFINEQNTTKYKKNKIEAYAEYFQLLNYDLTEAFLNRYKNLFLKIVIPQAPLWYES